MEKKSSKQHSSDKLNTADRKKLKDSDYGLPGKREFPIPDAEHVHAAESYFRYASEKEKPELARNIMKKAKEFGVDVESSTIKDWAKK